MGWLASVTNWNLWFFPDECYEDSGSGFEDGEAEVTEDRWTTLTWL